MTSWTRQCHSRSALDTQTRKRSPREKFCKLVLFGNCLLCCGRALITNSLAGYVYGNDIIRILCKSSNSIAIACFLFTLSQLQRRVFFCWVIESLLWLFLWLIVSDVPKVRLQGFNKAHTYLLTFQNYRWLLISFVLITCRGVDEPERNSGIYYFPGASAQVFQILRLHLWAFCHK